MIVPRAREVGWADQCAENTDFAMASDSRARLRAEKTFLFFPS